jgi:membrane dipeptidase
MKKGKRKKKACTDPMPLLSKYPIIVDAHEDLAYNHSLGRDLFKPAVEARKSSGSEGATTSFPDLLEGNVRVVFGTLWVNPCTSQFKTEPCYSTAEEAHAQAMSQLEYYKMLEKQGVISIIRNKEGLENVLSSERPKIGIVILMEGADPIRSPSEAREWFKSDLRIIGPAWGRTRYAGGTKAPGPLTKEGRELLKEMAGCGFILDCSHFSEESYLEALDIFDGPVIASHSNSKKYCPTDRHLSDEMIQKIASKDGVIGAVLYNGFLDGNWQKGDPKSDVTLSQVVKNIIHVSEITGNKKHSGIGSDFDGGFGYESIPLELNTSADLHKIGDALREQANYSEGEIEGVLSGNFLRVLRKALPD